MVLVQSRDIQCGAPQMQLTTMILLEGELALRRTAEKRDGEGDSPRPRSRTVELGDAPEAHGSRRLDGGREVGGGRRWRRIGRGPAADAVAV